MEIVSLKSLLTWGLLVKQNLPFWYVKSFQNTSSCLHVGNLLLQVKCFLKSHPQVSRGEVFFTPSRDHRNFLAFWKIFFSSQK